MKSSGAVADQLYDAEERLAALCRDPDIVWGAKAIGEVLSMNPREAYHFLHTGQIKAARQIGSRWCASRRELLREFVLRELGPNNAE
jgi:hypothetical protein